MDIDKLFKVPKLPMGGNKRKMPDNPTPEMLKKLKMDTDSAARLDRRASSQDEQPALKPLSRKATVQDEDDEEIGRRFEETFAPGGDADYFAEEDDEGRFFGGGLTSEQKEILNLFEKSEGQNVEDEVHDLSITQLRRSLQIFERAVNKNQDQRSKYPTDPSKFIDSEADLDSAIKSLLPLSQSPSLAYPELVRSGTLTMVIGLLTHENVDIVIDVIELLYELTDEDADIEDEEDQGDDDEALKLLIEALLANAALELLVDNLPRLNEQEEADRQGVFHVLGIFENMIGFNPTLATDMVSKTKILDWILNRIQSKTHDENRGYSAELLSIFLQNSQQNKVALGSRNGVEIILKVLSQYRRRDPIDAEETEFMENIFDALCSALSEITIRKLFLEAEGSDLMVLMIKDKHESRSRAIKVLDYAMSGQQGAAMCEAFVEVLGLKPLFMTLMNKSPKRSKANTEPGLEDISHILGIISSLLTNLPSDSTSRIRVLAKFVEGEYDKVDKILELRDGARKRLKATDAELKTERLDILQDTEESSDTEDTIYIRRLEGGLFTLQTVDYILAWLMMEDDGIRGHVCRMLDRGNQSLQDVLQTLREYHEHVDDDDNNGEVGQMISQKEILQALLSALESSEPS